MRASTEYSRQPDDEVQKRRDQRKREPDKMLATRTVSRSFALLMKLKIRWADSFVTNANSRIVVLYGLTICV